VVPTEPAGSEVVVIASELAAAVIVTANCFDAVCPAESVTVKVNVLVPALVGVPARTPAAENDIPVLQEPLQDGSVQV
jgi:hypothetical protein